MLSLVLNLILKNKYVRMALAALSLLVVFLVWHGSVKNAAIRDAVEADRALVSAATSELVQSRYKAAQEEIARLTHYNQSIELDLASRQAEITEVIRYETVYVDTPDCSRLGSDWLRVVNAQVNSGR